MTPLRIPLRAVFYKDAKSWIAHCLELDLVGHGATRQAAVKMLARAIETQIEASVKYNSPRNLFTPAEGKYFAMFAAGREVAVGRLEMRPVDPVTIEAFTTREYDASEAELAFAEE